MAGIPFIEPVNYREIKPIYSQISKDYNNFIKHSSLQLTRDTSHAMMTLYLFFIFRSF
jgi:hypothetical protein